MRIYSKPRRRGSAGGVCASSGFLDRSLEDAEEPLEGALGAGSEPGPAPCIRRLAEHFALGRIRVDGRADLTEPDPGGHGECQLADHLARMLRHQGRPENPVAAPLVVDSKEA